MRARLSSSSYSSWRRLRPGHRSVTAAARVHNQQQQQRRRQQQQQRGMIGGGTFQAGRSSSSPPPCRPPPTHHGWWDPAVTHHGPTKTMSTTRRACFSSTAPPSRRPDALSHLAAPTPADALELFRRMGSRPGSLLTGPSLLPSSSTSSSSSSMDRYNVDWTKHYRGRSSVVVRPESTDEVSRVLSYCHERRIGVVPQGGNTGLVGGGVPVSDEVVLSLEKMDRIHGFEGGSSSGGSSGRTGGGILRADAGCVLHALQDFAANAVALVPVDLGAKGTCQIGGNVSTNAGGVYYYRYGSLHANVMGVEVVLPAGGRVLNLGCHPVPHLKDNTGYDLKHLFIGGEGTLGVITQVAILCPPLPPSVGAVWLTCASLRDVLAVLHLAKTTYLGEILAAFEFMDAPVLELVQTTQRHSVALPVVVQESLSASHYSVLVETHGSDHQHDREKLQRFVEGVMEEGLVVDGIVAQDLGQVREFWKIREGCNPAAAATGYVYKYDVSLAASNFDGFLREVKARLGAFAGNHHRCVNWGHIIDGNLHCNIVSPGVFEKDEGVQTFVDGCVLEAVLRRNGSISAEHGLGQCKRKYLPRIKDAPVLDAMHAIKQLFDPHGIMNPGKYLPP